MSKQAFDKDENCTIEAQYLTEKKRYFCPNPECDAEMHLVLGQTSAFFSAYKDKKHVDNCPYSKYSDSAKTKIPSDFDIRNFYCIVLYNKPNKASLTVLTGGKSRPDEENSEITWVKSLSGLSRFCLTHSLDTPIDNFYTIDSLCVFSSNVHKYWEGYGGLKLIIGKVLCIDAYKGWLVIEVKSQQTCYFSPVKVEVDKNTAFNIIKEVKRKYIKYHDGFTASILCDCKKHKQWTTSDYTGKTYYTSVYAKIPSVSYIYVF